MDKLAVFVWAAILGQIVSFIGGSLTHGSYDFLQSLIVSLLTALIVILIGEASKPEKEHQ